MTPLRLYALSDLALQSLVLCAALLGLFEPMYLVLALIPLGLIQLSSALVGWWAFGDLFRAYYFGSALAFLMLGAALVYTFDHLPIPEGVEFSFILLYLAIALAAGLSYYLHSWRTLTAWGQR